MCLIGLFFLTIYIFSVDKHETKHGKPSYTTIFLSCMALLALLIPPKSLTHTIASTRSTTAQQNASSLAIKSTIDNFSSDLTRFDIADWNNLLASSPIDAQIVDKKAKFQGFVYSDGSSQKFIARFKLTCCAVDATPLAVPVLKSDTLDSVELGQWVNVEGVFKKEGNPKYPYQLEVTSIDSIKEPDEPYVY